MDIGTWKDVESWAKIIKKWYPQDAESSANISECMQQFDVIWKTHRKLWHNYTYTQRVYDLTEDDHEDDGTEILTELTHEERIEQRVLEQVQALISDIKLLPKAKKLIEEVNSLLNN